MEKSRGRTFPRFPPRGISTGKLPLHLTGHSGGQFRLPLGCGNDQSRAGWTKILGWPGYRVYKYEISEKKKKLKLWVRRKSGNEKLVCGGCGQRVQDVREIYEWEVRDLPWGEYSVTVVIELYRVNCPRCGVKAEKVEQLPSKAPFSKRFEGVVGQACESARIRRVAHRFHLPERTVRAIDVRYLQRWAARRPNLPCGSHPKPPGRVL